MKTKLAGFLENFILFVIVLVLIQTFLEDLAILLNWSSMVRQLLMVLGFVFDVIFTTEFFARSIFAASKGKFGYYFLEERGWIDFLASLPLLLFNSGPELFAFLTGGSAIAFGGILQVLKVVKVIRIARVLRLLRVLKIFRRIKNAEAVMTQRHVARIATMVVATMIIALLLFAIVDSFMNISDTYMVYEDLTQGAVQYIETNNLTSDDNTDQLHSYVSSVPIILLVKENGHTLYSRYSNEEYTERWLDSDYGYVKKDSLEIFVDISDLSIADAKKNLQYFFVIVILILMMMFIYSPHFAITISDPIHVMRKGFDEPEYNLQVHIPEHFRNDEIYLLASSFNSNYLPLKDRENQTEGSSASKLSMDDFSDLADLEDFISDEDTETDSAESSSDNSEDTV